MSQDIQYLIGNAVTTGVWVWLLNSTLATRRKAEKAAKDAERHAQTTATIEGRLLRSIEALRDNL